MFVQFSYLIKGIINDTKVALSLGLRIWENFDIISFVLPGKPA